MRIFPDNPTAVDLLGFRPVARAVAEVVTTAREPTTVGLHGPWGSGKSSLLAMIRDEISASDTHVVEINPWEFDDHVDVKGVVIGAVLGSLSELAAEDQSIKDKITDLLKRISWGRATAAIARGALTMQWDPDKLIEAFTPAPVEGHPGTMAGFRKDFAELVQQLGVARVVVLVDDLDRCLPSAVLATLESIKLFLSVPKMAFVLAADQDMVREAIAAGLGEQHRSSVFARDYLDKIVQVPVALPYATADDVEAYLALLLAQDGQLDDEQLHELVEHASTRRQQGAAPYLGGGPPVFLEQAHLLLAARCVAGLGGSDDVANPRRVKRFMNAYAVRRHAAAESEISLRPEILFKLFVLEHRFLDLFRQIASAPPVKRVELIKTLEDWATGDEDAAPPEGVHPDARLLLGSDPLLAEEDVDAYLALARRLSNTRVSVTASPEVEAAVRDLLSDRQGALERGLQRVAELDTQQQEQTLDEVLSAARTGAEPARALTAAIALTEPLAHLVDQLIPAIGGRRAELDAGHALRIAGIEALRPLADELEGDLTLDETVRNTLRESRR